MSKWIRGIYNAAANFNMSGSLRAASGRTMDRDRKLMREECEQSNESNITSKSDVATTSTSSSARASSSSSGTTAGSSGSTTEDRSVIIGNDVIITASNDICDEQCNKCHPTLCDHVERDYHEYTSYSATIRTEGQGANSWIRVSAEPRYNKQSNSVSTDSIEHITGIQSGVTV